jgi:hypothetical protein
MSKRSSLRTVGLLGRKKHILYWVSLIVPCIWDVVVMFWGSGLLGDTVPALVYRVRIQEELHVDILESLVWRQVQEYLHVRLYLHGEYSRVIPVRERLRECYNFVSQDAEAELLPTCGSLGKHVILAFSVQSWTELGSGGLFEAAGE